MVKEIEEGVTRKIQRVIDGGEIVVAASTVVYTEADHISPLPARAYSAKDAPPLFFLRGLAMYSNPRVLVGTYRLLAYSLSLPPSTASSNARGRQADVRWRAAVGGRQLAGGRPAGDK